MILITLRKVWGDLTHNKARTFLAVLSIAVGVLALGLAFGAGEPVARAERGPGQRARSVGL